MHANVLTKTLLMFGRCNLYHVQHLSLLSGRYFSINQSVI